MDYKKLIDLSIIKDKEKFFEMLEKEGDYRAFLKCSLSMDELEERAKKYEDLPLPNLKKLERLKYYLVCIEEKNSKRKISSKFVYRLF